MRQSKLVKSVNALNAWELRHLGDFVHSPFFNKHPRVTRLFELLIAGAAPRGAGELNRERIFAELFPGEPFHEQRFKDLLSLCMKTLRSFWTHFRLRQDEVATGMALVEEMRDRDQENEFEKACRQVEKVLQKSNEKMHIIRMKELALQESKINYLSTRHSRKVEDSLQVLSDQLDTYYLMAKLKYGVEMANRQNVLGQQFALGLLEPVLDHLKAHPGLLERNSDLRLYFLIYTFVREEDPAAFARFLAEVPVEGQRFSQIERRELYTYAMNFCIQQFNKGKRHYLQTLLQLYQLALGDDTLLEEGWLSHWNYKNIVSAGLKAGDFTWTAEFIEGYKPRVRPDERENAYTYNLASLHFAQHNYSEALRLLQHVEFQDVFYHLGAKVMLLKSFYELREDEALANLCDSFRLYLKRNKTLSQYHYTVNYNLVTFTRRLAELRRRLELIPASEGQKKLVRLRDKIHESEQVAQLSWLLNKLAELEGVAA